jgi:hypothetical protein
VLKVRVVMRVRVVIAVRGECCLSQL